MAKGFPTQNPPKGVPGIRPPAQSGSLMYYLEKNFPDVAKRVQGIHQHGVVDRKDSKYARKFPQRSGRVP